MDGLARAEGAAAVAARFSADLPLGEPLPASSPTPTRAHTAHCHQGAQCVVSQCRRAVQASRSSSVPLLTPETSLADSLLPAASVAGLAPLCPSMS